MAKDDQAHTTSPRTAGDLVTPSSPPRHRDPAKMSRVPVTMKLCVLRSSRSHSCPRSTG
ncbi:hypothetical protein HMPREF9570_02227 [Cutibacterium acnes HL043PA1]|nr:hypothetical protein HMPREF9570_02227 [Cutibacterium acnes HL043PA1]